MLPGYGFSVEQILNDLLKIYKQIDIYMSQSEENIGLFGKLSVRYFMKDNLIKVTNAKDYIGKDSKQEMPDSLWAVCQN